MSSDTPTASKKPVLLVFCDSLSYYGPTGGLPSDDPRGSGKDGWHITWDGERLSDHFPVRYWMLCPPDPDSVNAVAPNAQVSGAARPEATD